MRTRLEKIQELIDVAVTGAYVAGQHSGRCALPAKTKELLTRRAARILGSLKKDVCEAYDSCVVGKSRVVRAYPNNYERDPVNGTKFKKLIKGL